MKNEALTIGIAIVDAIGGAICMPIAIGSWFSFAGRAHGGCVNGGGCGIEVQEGEEE